MSLFAGNLFIAEIDQVWGRKISTATADDERRSDKPCRKVQSITVQFFSLFNENKLERERERRRCRGRRRISSGSSHWYK